VLRALLSVTGKGCGVRARVWHNTDGTTRFANPDGEQKYKEHLKLCKHALPIGEFMAYYREKLRLFVYHFSYMRMTSRMRVERQGITPGDITLIMDYSEKLNKMQRTQIQSQHWSEHAMTIEVAVAEAYPKLDPGKRAAIVARLLCKLAGKLNVTIDQMLEVTGHGKDEADGHGGVFKNWLLKPAAMNGKRRANSNTVERKFLTYTEADIRHAPEIVPMTSQLDRDAPGHRRAPPRLRVRRLPARAQASGRDGIRSVRNRHAVRAARRLRARRHDGPAERLEVGVAEAVRRGRSGPDGGGQ